MKYFVISEPWARFEQTNGEVVASMNWRTFELVRRQGHYAIALHPKWGEIKMDTRDPKVHVVGVEPSEEY